MAEDVSDLTNNNQPAESETITMTSDPWSEPVKISNFVKNFEGVHFADESALVYRKFKEVDRQTTLERWMSLDDETMKSLKLTMDPKSLLCGDEELDSTIVPDTEAWTSLNLRRLDINKKFPWHSTALRVVRVGAFKVDLSLPKLPEADPARCIEGKPIVGPESVLVLSYLLPATTIPLLKNIIGQFAVLGRTTLRSLVDRFKCDNDEVLPGDFCDQPFSRKSVKPMKETLTGCALFIEDVFYTDNWDYPNTIQEWAAQNNVGNYEVKNLQDVRFSELTVCLGKPYVYIHNGDCQHHVVCNDLRMLNPLRDDSDESHYPMLLGSFVHNSIRTLCQLCGKRAAQWAIKDHAKLSRDPFFICSGCNEHINYSNGKRKYNFKLLSYTDWGLL